MILCEMFNISLGNLSLILFNTLNVSHNFEDKLHMYAAQDTCVDVYLATALDMILKHYLPIYFDS